MQAAIGLEQVKKMDRVIAKRNENAGDLTQRLKVIPGVETPEEPPWGERVYYYYPSLEVNTSMVLFIMIDGLRPDAVAPAHCPHLATTLAKGASTLGATSVMPSITLPCHMSIFHSVPPTRHGVTTNEWSPMARPLPGLVDVARAARLPRAFFFNWGAPRNPSPTGGPAFPPFSGKVRNPGG